MNIFRFYIALILAKLINLTIKSLNLGHGYTWPGHSALKIYPDILQSPQIKFTKGLILITGTNGKTTTAKTTVHLLQSQGVKTVTNASGANLINGIISAILLDCDFFGKLRSQAGVFEVDEFSLPLVLNYLTPSALVLLNISRDQLDRYGETDIILEKWQNAITKLNTQENGKNSKTTLILYKDYPKFAAIARSFKGQGIYFDDSTHLFDKTNLKGRFNAKNVNAAFLTAKVLGLDDARLEESLTDFDSAYGRGEVIKYAGKEFHLFLAKNPASFNNNLDILFDYDIASTGLLLILNDNIPDGRDVSWIYDVDTGKLKAAVQRFNADNVYVSGIRALDMAIRLKYSGVPVLEQNVLENLNATLNRISQNPSLHSVVCLPNYSAMLELRKLLTGKSIL